MEEKIQSVKQKLQAATLEELPVFIQQYTSDERAGVKALVAKAQKTLDAYRREVARTKAMMVYEEKYSDYAYICGIDEVGPVVAGAVILPKDCKLLYLNDSKQLAEKKREELYDRIMAEAVAVGIGYNSPERIDEINILQATYEAMREAISKLSVAPTLLLNDAVTIPGLPEELEQVPIIKGDAKSISIAAASIVAKVTRDRLMVQYDGVFPEYGFAANKGYGSAAHIEALQTYGPCPIHRHSFIKNFF